MGHMHAGSLTSFQTAIEAAQATQLLSPAECNVHDWREALQALQSQLQALSDQSRPLISAQDSMAKPDDPSPAALVLTMASPLSTLHSSTNNFLQALETAWCLGLHENTTSALQTLRDWVSNAQQAEPVLVIDISKRPDSLPWDCDRDLACPGQGHQCREDSALTAGEQAQDSKQQHPGYFAGNHPGQAVLDLTGNEQMVDESLAAPVR